jgi:tetratricopeptide (TPR) repeat protein
MNDGKVAEAGVLFEELERTWFASPTLLANLAGCQMRTGRLEQGLATLDRAMRHLTPTPGMRNNRGLALQLLGRREEALEEFSRAVNEDPAYEPARINHIRLLASGGTADNAAAIREGERYLGDFPRSRNAPAIQEILDSLCVAR